MRNAPKIPERSGSWVITELACKVLFGVRYFHIVTVKKNKKEAVFSMIIAKVEKSSDHGFV